MKENQRIALIAAALLLGLAGLGYWLLGPAEAPRMAAAPVQSAPSEAPVVEPTSGEPAPETHEMPTLPADDTPLPTLAASDAPLLEALSTWAAPETVATWLVSEQIIRRVVATVDNLPRERVGLNERAIRRVSGAFLVKSRDGVTTTSPANEARYLPALALAQTVGAERLAGWYLRHYALFEQAYAELGYPGRRFNDRLVQVIDHLLAAPVIEGPIELVQPKVYYAFADPQLEALSAGQKMLIRMGSVNAAQAKAWLRAFRAGIVKAPVS